MNRPQIRRVPFSRDFRCDYVEGETNVVFNHNSSGYDPIAPHPSYSAASLYAHRYPTRSVPRSNRRQPYGLSSASGLRDNVAIGGPTREGNLTKKPNFTSFLSYLRQKDRLSISETSSISTAQSSIFDSTGLENTSIQEHYNDDDALDYPPVSQISVPFSRLPCEFIGYAECKESFDFNDVDSWIEHIICNHLKGCLPPKSVCWFCDELVFFSKSDQDLKTNFRRRMLHIRHHIITNEYTVRDWRPDYHLNDHLHQHHLIDDDVYNAVCGYSEIAWSSQLHGVKLVSPEAEKRIKASKVTIIDPAKEDKIRRRAISRRAEGTIRAKTPGNKIPKTNKHGSPSAHESRSRLIPPQLTSNEEDALAGEGYQKPLIAENKARDIMSWKNDVLNSFGNELDTFAADDNALSPASCSQNPDRGSPLEPISLAAIDDENKPKVTYGQSRTRSIEEKSSRRRRRPSTSTTASLDTNLNRSKNMEEGSWQNMFQTIISQAARFSTSRFGMLLRLSWPRRPKHLVRVSWICRCGRPLYIDVPQTQKQMAIEYAQAASGSTSPITVSQTTASGASNTTQVTGSPSSSASMIQSGPSAANITNGLTPGSIFIPPILPMGTKKYLLVCVNTGRYEIKLEQIDLTNVALDVSLFSALREKYESMRGKLKRNMFMVPRTVEYVKFELVRRSGTGECVGNYEKNSIPSQVEVAKKEYAFSPCPPRVGAVPVQPHIFMHSFLNPGDHLGELAVLQLPKKVGRRLKCVTQPRDPLDVPYGWGIYIVEGINTLLVAVLLIGALGVVTLAVLLWSALKSDVQGGTGIGQYALAVVGTVAAIGALAKEPPLYIKNKN
ncbi:hypothetical protein F5Y14DRAFT_420264 [Nemania sp. NC0429]|nr:hypothetical protein F5Y14DRAFT_420264 [Nemania sp. NC0429]